MRVNTIDAATDLARTSVNEFLKTKGTVAQWETALFLMYYAEKAQNVLSFSSEDLKQLFQKARISVPSNPSDIMNKVTQKGYIMDAPGDDSIPKKYILTDTGLLYVESYQPKEKSETKKISKPRKVRAKIESSYSDLCADDLNLVAYTDIGSLEKFVDKMILAIYIVQNEKRGELFTTADVQYLLTDVLGESVTVDQIKGVFTGHKTWFQRIPDEANKKLIRRRLLNAGVKYAEALLAK